MFPYSPSRDETDILQYIKDNPGCTMVDIIEKVCQTTGQAVRSAAVTLSAFVTVLCFVDVSYEEGPHPEFTLTEFGEELLNPQTEE